MKITNKLTSGKYALIHLNPILRSTLYLFWRFRSFYTVSKLLWEWLSDWNKTGHPENLEALNWSCLVATHRPTPVCDSISKLHISRWMDLMITLFCKVPQPSHCYLLTGSKQKGNSTLLDCVGLLFCCGSPEAAYLKTLIIREAQTGAKIH